MAIVMMKLSPMEQIFLAMIMMVVIVTNKMKIVVYIQV